MIEVLVAIAKNEKFAKVGISRTKPCSLCIKTQGYRGITRGKIFSFQKKDLNLK